MKAANMNIDAFLNEWREDETDEGWLDKEFCNLLDGKDDTNNAAEMWARIANGEASVVEALLWAQHVAKRLNTEVFASEVQANRRPDAALKAVGFRGRADPYREARQYMAILSEFNVILDDGTEVKPRLSGAQWVKVLKESGRLAGLDDKSANNLVLEWKKELGID